MVGENYKAILNKVNDIASRCEVDSKPTLIAVSKTKPVELLKEAYEAGARDFGENKVQELVAKYDELPKDIKWHLIGHLQTNKVKYIIDKAYMIHSVDSLKLAKEISKEAVKHDVTMNILIEVNVAEEESKFGVTLSECENLVMEVAKLPNILIRGFMTVAPFVDISEENREVFKKLKQLYVDIKSKNIDNTNIDCLSMGMSGDYDVAIEEGATYVRVGTAIFGERDYSSMI